MDEEGVKRKFAVVKNVFIFCKVLGAPKCAVLYELKISIITCGSGGEEEKIMVEPLFSSSKNNQLMPIEFFYDRRIIHRIDSVAACLLGSTLYVMPHDEEKTYGSDCKYLNRYLEKYRKLVFAKREPLPPYTLDLLHDKPKKREMPVFPFGRKTLPLMIAAGERIFALSGMLRMLQTSHPCFESLDPITFNWTQLEAPPFHNDQYFILGFVVLEEHGFILVSLSETRHSGVLYYSYNISCGVWLRVHLPQLSSQIFRLTVDHCIHKEAVVVGNDIYTYYTDYELLLVFPYHVVPNVHKDCDSILFGPVTNVEGLEFDQSQNLFQDYDTSFKTTATVAKVDDGILCLLHTLPFFEVDLQYFCVTFLQLLPDRKCNTLKSFSCLISKESVNLAEICISSCFVMNDVEENREHRRAKRANDADANTLIGMESGGTGEVEAM